MEILSQQQLKEIISKSIEEHNGLGNIINPIIEKQNLLEKEVVEVCQVGKYIYKINEDIQIVEKPKPPAPDFILKRNYKLIGLEHTRIFTEDVKAYQRIISLLSYTEKIFINKYPTVNVLASIRLKNDHLEYKQSEKRVIAKEIADYIYNLLTNDIENKKHSYIDNIKTSKHSQVSFYYDEYNFTAPYLTNERLKTEIRKKVSLNYINLLILNCLHFG